MKIAVIGANGKVGSLVVKEALKRGHEVLGFVRNTNTYALSPAAKRDILSITKEDLKDIDVLVSAVGFFTEDTFHLATDGLVHLAQVLKDTHTKLVVVGGAASLYLDASHQVQLFEAEDFPEEFKPLADSMRKGLNALRTFTDIDWTYMSPAADFDENGEVTGQYTLGGEEFFVNAEGNSYISYGDYALAMVDVIESKSYTRQRISIVKK